MKVLEMAEKVLATEPEYQGQRPGPTWWKGITDPTNCSFTCTDTPRNWCHVHNCAREVKRKGKWLGWTRRLSEDISNMEILGETLYIFQDLCEDGWARGGTSASLSLSRK